MRLLYAIIYQPQINYVLRNINFTLRHILPKSIRLNPSGKLRLRIKNKTTLRLHTNQTSHITKELFWNGSEHYEYTQIFSKLIKKADVFFDVGASIGYYSVLAGKSNPNIRTHSFEPARGSAIYLEKNIKENQLSLNTSLALMPLSNRCDQIAFNEVQNPKYPTTYNLSGEHNLGTKTLTKTTIYKLNTSTIDLYCQEHKIDIVDLIKIDTEGSEHLILEGGLQIITKRKPIIICETLYSKIEAQLEDIMKPLGYEFYNHIGGIRLEKVATIKRTSDNGVRNCFFIHPSKLNHIKEFIA